MRRAQQGRRGQSSAWLVGAFATIAAIASCGGGVRAAAPDTTKVATADEHVREARFSDLPAFRNVPWADALKAEQDSFDAMGKPPSRYGPMTIPDFVGTFTNVVDHERRTLHGSCAGCPHKTVWWFGASAAFGLGQRDDYTVASDLVRLGAAAGIDLEVRNLAIPGAVLVDEYDFLKVHLRLDPHPPDLVVFYDGFNDALYNYMFTVVNHGAIQTTDDFTDVAPKFLTLQPAPGLDAATIARVVAHTVKRYRQSQQSVIDLLGPRTIPVEYFEQPDAFVSPLQSSGLAKALNKTMAEISQKSDISAVLRGVSAGLATSVHNLRPLLADFDQPVFADPGHTNETGAQLVAKAVFDLILPRLR